MQRNVPMPSAQSRLERFRADATKAAAIHWRSGVIIAKTIDKRGRSRIREVLRIGQVRFDNRPGWILLSEPIGARPRKRNPQWVHPDDEFFVWIRSFAFHSSIGPNQS